MRHSKLLNVCIFVGLLAYLAVIGKLWQMFNGMYVYIFQSRDLQRAAELLNGHPIFYGPEMTGGGNLPGPLYYYLLAGFMAVKNTWLAAWWGMVVLSGVGAAGMWFFLRSRGLLVAAFLWLTLFATSGHSRFVYALFMNPSYLYLFLILLFMGIIAVFTSERGPARERIFCGICLLSGLAIQIHFSALILFAAALFMQIFSRRLKLAPVSKKTFWLGLLLFLVPSIPYLAWSLLAHAGIEFGQPSPYVGQPASALPTLLYLVRSIAKISLANTPKIILVQSLKIVPWPLFALAAAILIGKSRDEKFIADVDTRRLLKILFICAAFAFIPFAYVYFVPIAPRYGIPLCLSLILITVIVQDRGLNSPRRRHAYLALASALLAVAFFWSRAAYPQAFWAPEWRGLIVALIVGGTVIYLKCGRSATNVGAYALTLALAHVQGFVFISSQLPLDQSHLSNMADWRSLWRPIYRDTGWTLEVARRRIYFINTHIDEDPSRAYSATLESGPKIPAREDAPDGYFVAKTAPADMDFYNWILEQPVPEEIKSALRSGDIQLGPTVRGRVVFAPYRVKNTAELPNHFHDIALGYADSPDLEILQQIHGSQGSAKLNEHRFLFKWNECPDANRYCDNAAIIDAHIERSTLHLHVEVIGASLSQVSPWIHPTWTQAWNEPFLEVRCSGEVTALKLARSIGYKRENLFYQPLTGYFVANNSLIAPFERDFEIKCKGKLEELSVGRKSSSVDRLRDSIELPGQKLTLKF